MTHRRHLPTFGAAPSGPLHPRVDVARKRLGGRAATQAGVGKLVELTQGEAMGMAGVVLFVHGEELDVWTGEGRVQRTLRSRVRPFGKPASQALAALAADAAVFGHLREGDRVRYQDGKGNLTEGSLVEKCRYGALVLRDDAQIIAVGFRKVWPASLDAVRC